MIFNNKNIKTLLTILFSFLLVSCNNKETTNITNNVETDLSITESLLKNERHLDLSNKKLNEIPNLSEYDSIISLNLSNNLLIEINFDYLPKNLKRLNLSHNQIGDEFQLNFKEFPSIEEIDLSFNNLKYIKVSNPINKFIINNNKLIFVNINHKELNYLDISNNTDLSNIVDFYPNDIDTLLRKNISNDLPLKYKPFVIVNGE